MAANQNQNGQSNGPLSNGGNPELNMAPIFSITPQIASGSNMVTTMTFNAAPDRQALPPQPPLSDFLGQVNIELVSSKLIYFFLLFVSINHELSFVVQCKLIQFNILQ